MLPRNMNGQNCARELLLVRKRRETIDFLKCGISNALDGSEDRYLEVDSDDFDEMEDRDDYTADIEMLDETYNALFPSATEESDVDDYDDMPDETFKILSQPEDDD